MTNIAHAIENIGKSGRPCLTCGEPHTLRPHPHRAGMVTWASDSVDQHPYREMSSEQYWRERALAAEAKLAARENTND